MKRKLVWLVKKPLIFGLVSSTMLLASGLAWAYWTSTGTGTAPGTAGPGSTVVITGALTTGGTLFVPGKAVLYTLVGKSNTNTGGTVRVGTVTLTGVDSSDNTCDTQIGGSGATAVNATNGFTMPDVVVNDDIVADGADKALTPDQATITFNNDPAASQNACKSATFTFTFTTN